MAGNYGICHSCRCSGHSLADCPNPRKFPELECRGVLRIFEVKKKSVNFGRLFENCSKCKYFKWRRPLTNLGESSGVLLSKLSQPAADASESLARAFEKLARITDDSKDLKIKVSLTIEKGKGKGKGGDVTDCK